MIVKAYITKYCLSTGITIAEGEIFDKNFAVRSNNTEWPQEIYENNDWHLKWEDALARAEHCRLDRIRSEKRRAKRTVTKLENLTFSKPELVQ